MSVVIENSSVDERCHQIAHTGATLQLRILLNTTTYNGARGAMRYEIHPARCNGYSPPVGHSLKECPVSALHLWQECRLQSLSWLRLDAVQEAI
jgi:hypothetical protein